MWNLEQTERFLVRMLPVVIVVTVMLLWMMSYPLQPQRLSAAFSPSVPTVVALPHK